MCQQQFLEGSQANKPSQCPLHDSQRGGEGGKIIKMRGQEDFKLLRADERGQVVGGGGEDNERLWERLRGGSRQRLGDRGRWGQTEGNLRNLACTRESRQARSSARRHEESKITPPPSLSIPVYLPLPLSAAKERSSAQQSYTTRRPEAGQTEPEGCIYRRGREERERGGTRHSADG